MECLADSQAQGLLAAARLLPFQADQEGLGCSPFGCLNQWGRVDQLNAQEGIQG